MFDETVLIGTALEIGKGPYFDSCPVCGKQKPIQQKTCSRVCAGSLVTHRKKPEEIKQLVFEIKKFGYSAVARTIGVSDNTLRKWLRKEKIRLPRFRKRRSHH